MASSLPAGNPSAQPSDAEAAAEATRLTNRGVELKQTQRVAEAEQLLREALSLAESKLNANDRVTASCLNNLGEFLSFHGRLEEALEYLPRAVRATERAHGADSASIPRALRIPPSRTALLCFS